MPSKEKNTMCLYGMLILPKACGFNCKEMHFRIRYWKTILSVTGHSDYNYLCSSTMAYVFHSNYTIDLRTQRHWAKPIGTVPVPVGIVSPMLQMWKLRLSKSPGSWESRTGITSHQYTHLMCKCCINLLVASYAGIHLASTYFVLVALGSRYISQGSLMKQNL